MTSGDLSTRLADKADVSHNHDASSISSGTLDVARIPTGTTRVVGTDGLDILLGYLGPSFPYGLIVVHDSGQLPVSDNVFIDARHVFGEWSKLPFGSRAGGSTVKFIGMSVKGQNSIVRTAIRSGDETISLE